MELLWGVAIIKASEEQKAKGYNMAALKSNSSSAAIAINAGLAAELIQPKAIFDYINASKASNVKAAYKALISGNWAALALVALAMANKQARGA